MSALMTLSVSNSSGFLLPPKQPWCPERFGLNALGTDSSPVRRFPCLEHGGDKIVCLRERCDRSPRDRSRPFVHMTMPYQYVCSPGKSGCCKGWAIDSSCPREWPKKHWLGFLGMLCRTPSPQGRFLNMGMWDCSDTTPAGIWGISRAPNRLKLEYFPWLKNSRKHPGGKCCPAEQGGCEAADGWWEVLARAAELSLSSALIPQGGAQDGWM